MRKFYNLFLILFVGSSFSFAQKVLNTPTAENSIITDPVSITMTPGFSVKSVSGSTFRAFIDSNGNGIPDGQEAEFPTLNENYVRTIECLNAPCSKKKETVIYFDGLGREKQALQVAASPTGKTIITPYEYDGFGRQIKEFLPFPISSSDNKISSQRNGASFYNNLVGDSIAYSQKTLENSPLNRVLFQAAPGESWKKGSGHEIGFKYESNTIDNVLRFDVSLSQTLVPSLVPNGSYQANKLYKTITTDENGQAIQEFKDQEGRVILKRIDIPQMLFNSYGKHDTYYVYDVYGNLTYVLPPKLIEVGDYSINNLAELGYQYQYDDKNRLVEKQLPGKGREFMVYDNQDRLTLQQDANQRTATDKGWTFFKYDKLGRIVYSGFFKNTATRSAMQSALNNKRTPNNEERTIIKYRNNELNIYYTNSQFPNGSLTVQTVNYYDNYESLEMFAGSLIAGQELIGEKDTRTKGLAVATLTNVLGTTKWNKSYTFYDTEYVRPSGTHLENYLDGFQTTSSSLDFRGKVLNTITKHKLDDINTPEITINEVFDYYDNELLKSQTHQINGGPVEYIVQNSYNEINQIISKKVGNDNASTPLQTVDYKYNIRGWMTDINNVDITNDDLFSFRLNYDKLTQTTENPYIKALYNGNIGETIWKTSPDHQKRSYSYAYDGLNRLLFSDYLKNNSETKNAYNEQIAGYDKNGNINGIFRTGANESSNLTYIDLLSHRYQTNSNKLISVEDTSNVPEGFDDKNKTGNDYDYDLNGNLIQDLNKEITKISYNDLNLPIEVLWNASKKINYSYDASGVKLRKVVTDGTQITTTDYSGGFQYKKNGSNEPIELQFFPTAEGYVNVTENNTFNYVYNYTDHLGNVRLSYQKDTNGLKILEENNYYPYGLKHSGYNNTNLANSNYNYKHQGQERQTELGLNWDSFKWRNYDPTIGRFFNIDPLAEKYSYQSPYNFQENKMGLGRELEGLEIALPPWIGMAGGTSFGTSVSSATATFGPTMSATSAGLTSASGTVGVSISTTAIPLDQTIQLEETTISNSSSKGGFWSNLWDNIKSGARSIGRVFNNDSNTTSEGTNSSTKAGRGSNNRTASDEAEGDHSVINESGNTTYRVNQNNPNKNSKGTGFETEKRVDYKGNSHKNSDGESFPTPHVHEKNGKIRPAIPGEDMPKNLN
ncbi:DUF6443 domain-containing protein [Chishuiella changwenlii]|uniref:DUF6443 domain-containing protein n=1 Tax=Chishuiella changwenlii TaxID=1434701 RepID=UPI002FD95BFD